MKRSDQPLAARICQELEGIAFAQGAPAYEAARRVWNATIDRHPLVVVAPSTAQDVQRAVNQAQANGLAVSVRGGGHNIAGSAVGDGTLMIDLSAMNGVRIDPENRVARVQGGATWANVDAAAQVHGFSVPGGVVSSTGVGGLTLGGGIGWQSRKHGLSIDSLLSVEIVLASGDIVRASPSEHGDLFWALRGGGGNFGVVTEFVFRLHDTPAEVTFGPTFFDLEDADHVLTSYAREAGNLTREACVWANLTTAPSVPVLPENWHGRKVLILMQFHARPVARAREELASLYGGVTPLGSALAARPFVEAQGFLDPAYEFGARNYWRTHNHVELTPGLISTLVELAPDLPTPESELLISQLGGAVGDVPGDATAFAHRDTMFLSTPGVRWHDAADDARMIAWLSEASDRMAKHAAPGTYSNFVAESGNTAPGNYGGNLKRLRDVKHQYDPGNIFRVNQNIAPTPPPGVA